LPHQHAIRVGPRIRAGLDQHDAGAPFRQVVSKRTYLEPIVVAPDAAGDERLQRVSQRRANLLRADPARVVGARLVERHREQRDGCGLPGLSNRGPPILVVQVEANRGIQPVAQPLEREPFRRLQQQGVAVDVDALSIPPLETLGAVRVQHRHQMQFESIEKPRDQRLVPVTSDEIEKIEERHRRGGLVAVHLRPQQDAERSASEGDVIDRAAFDRGADRLGRDQIGRGLPQAVDGSDNVRVAHQRRRWQRKVLGVP
jgi:hypothetical protein